MMRIHGMKRIIAPIYLLLLFTYFFLGVDSSSAQKTERRAQAVKAFEDRGGLIVHSAQDDKNIIGFIWPLESTYNDLAVLEYCPIIETLSLPRNLATDDGLRY